MDNASPDPSFEDSLHALERIVEKLENDPPPLEEALAFYEEGTAHATDCMETLDDAEQRITELSLDDDA
ncbi:exodeoxyribonuclease VII small subunit [Salisaeta longa]|uniref:exodeoxyribonuclease VII small subunit n=1 Tax=Salisaeta longa TaxID=503170 RepID=UPI0003B328C3|nr:exodeoxyribonuclease VII small subunit [Salisaeta longa]